MRTIHQGEGGEQGDVLMPLLFSLGQHGALAAVQRQLHANEKMFAYLHDINIVTTPARVGHVHGLLRDALYGHAHIRLHCGKTQVWNSGGIRPEACDALERVARAENPRAVVWKGSDVPPREQGIKVLGTPSECPDFVSAHLERTIAEHQVLLDQISHVPDVHSAWLILRHCAAARANHLIRVVSPDQVRGFAESHDSRLWACLCQILQIPPESCDHSSRVTATLPLVLGGCGLWSATRTSQSAFWASRAELSPYGPPTSRSRCRVARPSVGEWHRHTPLGCCSAGSKGAGRCAKFRGPFVEREFRDSVVFPSLTDGEKALVRSQSGSGAGTAMSTVPTHQLVRTDSPLFRVLLSRRLRLPLLLVRCFCRCGRSIDVYGHHRLACARAEILCHGP